MSFARTVMPRNILRSIFDDPAFWHSPQDIHARHAEDERLYRLQTDECPTGEHHVQEHDSNFHYANAASFDPHP
jgi:hypothetical protein